MSVKLRDRPRFPPLPGYVRVEYCNELMACHAAEGCDMVSSAALVHEAVLSAALVQEAVLSAALVQEAVLPNSCLNKRAYKIAMNLLIYTRLNHIARPMHST